ncbi:uncharacterized protein [Magallana gigas]|uniref:uncharacterized protein n=1 Tax=Magallana gigas TaxID=29159 RepID=UPI003341CE52
MEGQTEKVDTQEKGRLLSYISMMSVVALCMSVVSIIVGILVFVYLGGGGYPITSATGIWYSFLPISFGIVGIAAGRTTDETTQTKLLGGHYTASILLVAMGYALATAIQGVVTCATNSEKCGTHRDTQLALHIVLLCVILVGYILAVVSMCIHLRNRNILHPDWKYRRGCCGRKGEEEPPKA